MTIDLSYFIEAFYSLREDVQTIFQKISKIISLYLNSSIPKVPTDEKKSFDMRRRKSIEDYVSDFSKSIDI